MSNFQISALPMSLFQSYFLMTEAELEQHDVTRQIVNESPGSPCRVSLQDAEVGETVILLNYQHLPDTSPFQSAHAIFVREDVAQRKLAVNEVPQPIRNRLMSVRAFDQHQMMLDADCVSGAELEPMLHKMLSLPNAHYVHLHYAKPGCFAARVDLVTDTPHASD